MDQQANQSRNVIEMQYININGNIEKKKSSDFR